MEDIWALLTKILLHRLKDGMVAAEQCSRYHMDGNSLVIRDVAEEDAGKYTVLVRIQEHDLYQNLTLTLVVNGEKPSTLQRTFSSITDSQRLNVALVSVCVCVGVLSDSESTDRGESGVVAGPGLSSTGEQTSPSLHVPRGPPSTHPVALAPLPVQRPVSSPDAVRKYKFCI